MYKGKTIGVVIPAYNEEKLIRAVIVRAPEYIDRLYVIDDCSTDKTAAIVNDLIVQQSAPIPSASSVSRTHNSQPINDSSAVILESSKGEAEGPQGGGLGLATRNSELRTQNSKLTLISHPINQGVGAAIVTGYKACLADNIDIAVVMAGDNQMDPDQLPRLLDPIIAGQADYAVGDRLSNLKHQKGMSPWRRSGNFILKWLTRVAAWNLVITDPQNGYTAVSREALEKLASLGRSARTSKPCPRTFTRPGIEARSSKLDTGNSLLETCDLELVTKYSLSTSNIRPEVEGREDLTQGGAVNPKLETRNLKLETSSTLDHIYPRYGYCNDMLVKFSASGARIKQIQMPAVYGEEKSKIRYHKYIPTVSWLLLKGFLWRISLLFRRPGTNNIQNSR